MRESETAVRRSLAGAYRYLHEHDLTQQASGNISARVDNHILISPGGAAGPEIADLDYLGQQGVRICLQGHAPFMAAVQAVHDTLKALRDGTAPADLTGVAAPELMRQATRDADYKRWSEDFLQ